MSETQATAELIPVFSNTLGAEELQAVETVFRSRWLGQGRECAALERELAGHWRAEHVLLMNNCTACIFIALEALGIGPGDEVIVSTINFVACGGAVCDLGATPVFADVDPHTLNILPGEIERLRTSRTRAVMVLHYGGHPCDLDAVRSACGGLALIEDSANAVGSTYAGRACGTIGDAGVFSFDAMKILVMADGGALVVKEEAVARKARALRYLGLPTKTASGMTARGRHADRWWEYDLEATSGRFISNDVLAAIGRVQLRKLPQFLERRRTVWRRYQEAFEDLPGVRRPPEPPPQCTSSYYLYWIQLEERRDALAAYLAEQGIYTTMRYHPLHRVKYFKSRQPLPNAEAAARRTLNLPLHQNLSDDDVQWVVDRVRAFVSGG